MEQEYSEWLTLPRYQIGGSDEYYADIQRIKENLQNLINKKKLANVWAKEKPNFPCKFVAKTIEEGGYTNYRMFEIIKEGNWLMLYNNLTDEWIDLKDLIDGEYLILEKEYEI